MRGYKKTDADEQVVKALAAAGLPHADIARAIGIRPTALRKHYRDILQTAALHANAKVTATLFAAATSGKEIAATIFWMKVRLGWKETTRVENLNPSGGQDVRALLAIMMAELKDQPEVRYRIAQRLHAAEKESDKIQ